MIVDSYEMKRTAIERSDIARFRCSATSKSYQLYYLIEIYDEVIHWTLFDMFRVQYTLAEEPPFVDLIVASLPRRGKNVINLSLEDIIHVAFLVRKQSYCD